MKDTFFKKEIEPIEKQIRAIYDPKTAFGNRKLKDLLDYVCERIEWYESTDVCDKCEGSGYTEHDCGCELCQAKDEECSKCYGAGRTEIIKTP